MKAKDVLSKKVKILRAKQGWTQGDLARKVGVSLGTISQIEVRRQFPSLPLITALAEALGCEETDLFAIKSDVASEPRRSDISERRAKLILKDVAQALGYKVTAINLEAA
jgi:putative transcriptional regulator